MTAVAQSLFPHGTLGQEKAVPESVAQGAAPTKMRYYQEAGISAVLDARDSGVKASMLCLATGAGKTFTAAELIRRLGVGKDGRTVLWLAHFKELLEQASKSIGTQVPYARQGWEMGNQTADHYDQIIFSTIQSFHGHRAVSVMERLRNRLVLVVIDEAHRSASASYRDVILTARELPKASVLGLTATPNRTDKVTLADLYDEISYSYPFRQAISDGYLLGPRGYKITTETSLESLKPGKGDYTDGQLAKVINIDRRNQLAVDSWHQYARDQQTIVFCAGVKHAESVAELFNSYGIPALAVSGTTEDGERAAAFKAFRDRRVRVLCGANLFVEGYDEPGVRAVIFARPTKSSIYYQQALGRGARPDPATAKLLARIDDRDARLSTIASSSKPDFIAIDLVDVSSRGIMTLSSLFGAKQAGEHVKLKIRGEDEEADSAADREQQEKQSKIVPVGDLGFREEKDETTGAVAVRIEPFDILSAEVQIEKTDRNLAWQPNGRAARTIAIPPMKVGLLPGGVRSQLFEQAYDLACKNRDLNPVKQAQRADPNATAAWLNVIIEVAAQTNSQWLVVERSRIDRQPSEERTVHTAESAEKAMAFAERYIRQRYNRVIEFLDRNAPWRSLPPKRGQIDALQKRGIEVPQTRGECADILNAIIVKGYRPVE